MNIVSLTEEVEKVSKNYSKKFNIKRDSSWYVLKLQEELGELIQSYLMMKGKGRAKGKSADEIKMEFEQEVADVFCHVLLLAKHHGIDLSKATEEKWLKWNK
jgi:NTP pyrophosphatase (non-canonical NTP hydrolase)